MMNLQQSKFRLVLAILLVGMAFAIAFYSYTGYCGYSYPYNTFLFDPKARFSDFTDSLRSAHSPDPYLTPAAYPPVAYVLLRLFSPGVAGLLIFLATGIIPIAWLLSRTLRTVFQNFLELLFRRKASLESNKGFSLLDSLINSTARVYLTLLLMICCEPLVICMDRANIELWVIFMVGMSIFCYCRASFRSSVAWLVLPICLKMYPVLLLTLFLRRNTWHLIVLALAVSVAITVFAYSLFDGGIVNNYLINQLHIEMATNKYLIGFDGLSSTASPWNLYRVTAMTLHAIQTGTFFDSKWDWSSLIPQFRAALPIYTSSVTVITGLIALYAALIEREVLRRIVVLLIFMVIASPSGGGYKITHIGTALVAFILIKTHRRGDFVVLALLAFALVPKKEYMFTCLGITDSYYADVSSGVVLNPMVMLGALIILCWNGILNANGQWSRQRLRGLISGLRPAWMSSSTQVD
jgi:hypothetical protein